MLHSLYQFAEHWIRRIRVRRCLVPFVILFLERTGSTHLCSLLSNHPEVVCRHEDFCELGVNGLGVNNAADHVVPDDVDASQFVTYGKTSYRRALNKFKKKQIINPTRREITQHFYDIYSCPAKACGFKFKFPIQVHLFPEVLNELHSALPELRIIALRRQNTLKQSISRENMMRIRQAENSDNLFKYRMTQPFDATFSIDVPSVLKYARQLKQQNSEFDEAIEQLDGKSRWPTQRLFYEDLLNDQTAVVRSLFEFLEVDVNVQIFSGIRKATPDDLASAILNYDELEQAIAGTEFASML